MRSYIDVVLAIDVLNRTGVVIAKPSVPQYGVSKKRKVNCPSRGPCVYSTGGTNFSNHKLVFNRNSQPLYEARWHFPHTNPYSSSAANYQLVKISEAVDTMPISWYNLKVKSPE